MVEGEPSTQVEEAIERGLESGVATKLLKIVEKHILDGKFDAAVMIRTVNLLKEGKISLIGSQPLVKSEARMKKNKGLFVAVDGRIERDGKVLLMKRKYSPNKGKWQYPGGRVNLPDETLPEACRREVLEETGFHVEVGDVAGIHLMEFRDVQDNPIGKSAVIIIFNCKILSGVLNTEKLKEEAEDWGWFSEYPENCSMDYSAKLELTTGLDKREYGIP